MNHDAPTHQADGGSVLTITPETTLGELQAWLDEHRAKLTFRLETTVDYVIRVPLTVELNEAIFRFWSGRRHL